MEKKPRSVAMLAAGLLVGGAAAGALVVSAANAATADPTLTASSSGAYPSEGGTTGSSGESRSGHAYGGDQGHDPDEQSVSADVAAKLRAAALKAVPGGTVVRVETDSGGAEYEAHMKKSDGSSVTVKFDKNLSVTGVEDGMGTGPDGSSSGQGRHGGPGSPGDRPSNGPGGSGPSA